MDNKRCRLKKKPPATELDFEQSLAELENLIEAMESGELTLEQSIQHFERGVALTKRCQKSLSAAEQKVQILMQDDDTERLANFPDSDGHDKADR